MTVSVPNENQNFTPPSNPHTAELSSRVASLSIDKTLIDPSKPEILEKAIMEAINDSLQNVRLALQSGLFITPFVCLIPLVLTLNSPIGVGHAQEEPHGPENWTVKSCFLPTGYTWSLISLKVYFLQSYGETMWVSPLDLGVLGSPKDAVGKFVDFGRRRHTFFRQVLINICQNLEMVGEARK